MTSTPGRVRWAVLPADRAPACDGSVRSTTHRARLGDQVVIWSADGTLTGSWTTAARLGAARSELSLVTQVGRAFQDAHPRIPVIIDHGRHLVVDGGRALRHKDDTCWRVEPLPPDSTVVDRPEPRSGRAGPVAAGPVAAIDRDAYAADVTWMAGLPTRHSLSDGFRQAADRAAAVLADLGYATSRFPVTVGGGQSADVLADRPGSAAGERGVVLITAHLDSVNLAGGASAAAPGADDNASGSAGVLTLARALTGRAWEHDVRLILFGGEEQGLFGSKQYVAALPAAERARIRAVLNMDMIATRNGPAPTVLLEGAPVSRTLVDDLAAAAAAHTGLVVETSLNPFASDHVPFINAGIPAVLTIEGNDSANGNIHSDRDVLAHLDFDYAVEILRMNVAALSGWLVPAAAGSRPRPAGPVVSRGPGRLDVFVTGTDQGLYRKSWDGSAWQPSITGYQELGSRP